jgi:hypothetical protein
MKFMTFEKHLYDEEWRLIRALASKNRSSKSVSRRNGFIHEVAMLQVQFLKYSPYYYRVFKDKSNKKLFLTIPPLSDEEKIIATTRLYGDVWTNDHQPLQAMTRPHPYRNIDWMWIHKKDAVESYNEDIQNYVINNIKSSIDFSKDHDHVYLKIPLMGNINNVISEVRDVIEVIGFNNKKEIESKLTLTSKRIHFDALNSGLTLLKNRTLHPNLELWRLGLMIDVSSVYGKLLNASSKIKISSFDEVIYRESLAKLTHRSLKKYESVAENAARGLFPTSTPKSNIKFDYLDISKRISKEN